MSIMSFAESGGCPGRADRRQGQAPTSAERLAPHADAQPELLACLAGVARSTG
ncbi:Uncharacterised protein [Mycobacterium tuberculosis]|uniref:Uncharacterized protein n=1 Tax=Mycobacterium tuberculosis TaxID=1773 RepID=A0A655JGA0_MYCTX|nr:Uncharacterised protein [Mycobacterium tuberculosis]